MKTTALFLTIILGASSAHAVGVKLTCQETVSTEPLFEYHKGEAVESQNGVTRHRLGIGMEGGTVYRHSTLSEEYILKLYKHDNIRDRDAKTLKMLKQHESETGFLIPEVNVVGEKELVIDDIKGLSVKKLIADNNISDDFKERVVNAVIVSNMMLIQFIAKMYDIPFTKVLLGKEKIEIKGNTTTILRATHYSPDGIQINVHLDNIIVEHETGELHIPDPY